MNAIGDSPFVSKSLKLALPTRLIGASDHKVDFRKCRGMGGEGLDEEVDAFLWVDTAQEKNELTPLNLRNSRSERRNY